ncbi:MAG: hypothetical protein U1E95_07250 [Rubrivivax sp.]
MGYLAVSEVGRRRGDIWRRVAAGQAVGLTRRGPPIAMVIGVGLDECKAFRAYRAARLGAVVRRLQAGARASGADRLSDEEIQADIDAVREERRLEAVGA